MIGVQDRSERPEGAITRPFYFLRHGETLYNREGRMQGQSDVPLSDLGLRQAEEAALLLADLPIERIVSSSLGRAMQTAEAAAKRLGLPIESEPHLMEAHFGIHQDRPHPPWVPDFWAGRFHPEGGEDFWQFRDRVWPALVAAVAAGPNTLVVAHGGVWFAARTKVRMLPDVVDMPNALPVQVVPDGEIWQVRPLGERTLPEGSDFYHRPS